MPWNRGLERWRDVFVGGWQAHWSEEQLAEVAGVLGEVVISYHRGTEVQRKIYGRSLTFWNYREENLGVILR